MVKGERMYFMWTFLEGLKDSAGMMINAIGGF